MTVAVSLDALPRRRMGDVARDYVALTKPRVIVLLEVTAVAAMVIADRGWPGWRLAGGVGSKRDQLLVRSRHRSDHGTDQDPAATLSADRASPGPRLRGRPRRRVLRADGHDGQPALREPGPARPALLRVRLHDVAEALLDAEHRHRGRGG